LKYSYIEIQNKIENYKFVEVAYLIAEENKYGIFIYKGSETLWYFFHREAKL